MDVPEHKDPAQFLAAPDRLVLAEMLRNLREPQVPRAVRARRVAVTPEPGAARQIIFEE